MEGHRHRAPLEGRRALPPVAGAPGRRPHRLAVPLAGSDPPHPERTDHHRGGAVRVRRGAQAVRGLEERDRGRRQARLARPTAHDRRRHRGRHRPRAREVPGGHDAPARDPSRTPVRQAGVGAGHAVGPHPPRGAAPALAEADPGAPRRWARRPPGRRDRSAARPRRRPVAARRGTDSGARVCRPASLARRAAGRLAGARWRGNRCRA